MYKAFNPLILSPFQSGFRKGHSTQESIQALVDTMEDTVQQKAELHVVYVDMKKAYDSVPHATIIDVLQQYGVNPIFVNAIAGLYKECTFRLNINRELTDSQLYTKGMQQGDRLSLLLFIVFLNPMLVWLAKECHNTGYRFTSGYQILVLAYCDDIALVGHSFTDISGTYSRLVQYYEYFNLEINQVKSGYTNNTGNNELNLDFQNIPIKKLETHEHYRYLGVWLSMKLGWD
jgi:hypothetical protein